jgi:hypothetical protein
MPEPEKPPPKREQPEPETRRTERVTSPGGEVAGDDNDDEQAITQRTPRLPDELVIDEIIDDER